jgi:hypothetical protein
MKLTPHSRFEVGGRLIPGYSFRCTVDGVESTKIYCIDTAALTYEEYEFGHSIVESYAIPVEKKAVYIGVFVDAVNPRIEIKTKF